MRTLSAKGEATREKILRAASDLFYINGYHATGLDWIIADAGVAKGNFYHHFKSKEELATAVLDWHRDLAFEEVELEHILAIPSPLNALLELVTRMTARMVSDVGSSRIRGCFFGNFALELATTSEPVRSKVNNIFNGIRHVFQQLIENGQAAGEVRVDLDAEASAGLILGLMEGAVLLDKAGQSAAETKHAIGFIRSYLSA